MALLYKAVLTPSKLDLLQSWVPGRRWFASGPSGDTTLTQVGSYRFDDPDGEVGIESMLVQTPGGPVLHVPLTYRAAPLEGGEGWLTGTVDHSVLGTRWVYDACGDPVYARVLAAVILGGGSEVEQHWEIDGAIVQKPLDTAVRGSGTHPQAAVAEALAGSEAAASEAAASESAADGANELDETSFRVGGVSVDVVRRPSAGDVRNADGAETARGGGAGATGHVGATGVGDATGQVGAAGVGDATAQVGAAGVGDATGQVGAAGVGDATGQVGAVAVGDATGQVGAAAVGASTGEVLAGQWGGATAWVVLARARMHGEGAR